MSKVIYVDFKTHREQNETMAKIKAENFNASTRATNMRAQSWVFDEQNGHPLEVLEALIKPYALNKETEE